MNLKRKTIIGRIVCGIFVIMIGGIYFFSLDFSTDTVPIEKIIFASALLLFGWIMLSALVQMCFESQISKREDICRINRYLKRLTDNEVSVNWVDIKRLSKLLSLIETRQLKPPKVGRLGENLFNISDKYGSVKSVMYPIKRRNQFFYIVTCLNSVGKSYTLILKSNENSNSKTECYSVLLDSKNLVRFANYISGGTL